MDNMYGQKQAGRVWYRFLVKGLLELGCSGVYEEK
jgi:hypothetical protein